jgi:hypothetical protein
MDLLTELNSKNNTIDLLSNKSIIDELQQDLLTQINESVTILPKYNIPVEIPLELINREFYDPKFYFGVLNSQNNTYQYILVPGEGDNNKFIIIQNIVYSRFPFVFDKSEYSITIEAKDPISLNIFIKSFTIKPFNPNANYNTANIMSCHITQTLPILFTGFLHSIEMKLDNISPIKGSISQQTTNFFIYTPPNDGSAPNDNIVFNIINTNNGEIIDKFAIMVEVFDNNRIQRLPRQIGTHKFDNISFDTNISIWKLGNYSTRDFYIFNYIYVIRNLHIFFNELFLMNNYIIDNTDEDLVFPGGSQNWYIIGSPWYPWFPIWHKEEDWLRKNIMGLNISEAKEKINNSFDLIETGDLRTFNIVFIDKNAMFTTDFNLFRIIVLFNSSTQTVIGIRDRG